MKFDALRVVPGRPVSLAALDPRATPTFEKKSDASDVMKADLLRMSELQEVLAAARTHAMLLVFQGMDSAGKDSAIAHVMSGVNPQGVEVHSFKTPTEEEVDHDFLWRCERVVPERGRIGIFNRSHYEEVVVVRVHQELLAREAETLQKITWSERYEDINNFERHLARSGTVVLKFFLHLSKEEQRKRLLSRLDDADKNWKFSINDIHERRYWDEYQTYYEDAINATSTEWAPWYVIPADHKWFVRVAIADIIVSTLDSLGLAYPKLTGDAAAKLAHFRHQLEAK